MYNTIPDAVLTVLSHTAQLNVLIVPRSNKSV